MSNTTVSTGANTELEFDAAIDGPLSGVLMSKMAAGQLDDDQCGLLAMGLHEDGDIITVVATDKDGRVKHVHEWKRQKWEYLTAGLGEFDPRDWDDHGREGWELVSVQSCDDGYIGFFKRPIADK